MALPQVSSVIIIVGGYDVTGDAVWKECNFSARASAEPGTCQIVVRDPNKTYAFQGGEVIKLLINDQLMWQGYLFTVDQGYMFADDAGDRKWTLSGVDLNILFDKLILYNHAYPTRSLDGGGTFQRLWTDNGYIVQIPLNTSDRTYIQAMLKDTDIGLVSPTIDTVRYVGEVGLINPDGYATPPTPGGTLRGLMEDASGSVLRQMPGSSIWYIDPAGYLHYQEQDSEFADFWVGDEDPSVFVDGVTGINVRQMRVSIGIGNIKNDVLVFTGNLNPLPGASQDQILYTRLPITESINRYGRFQYSEILSQDWLQDAATARANKLAYQEGGPAVRAEFTTYTPGFYPGQLVNIVSANHIFRWYDTVLGFRTESIIRVPIRAIDMTFETPTTVQYRMTCSYDTKDPWGLLFALRRPATRGLTQPAFNVIDRTKTPPDPLEPAQTFTFVREYPTSLGGGRWQTSYAYIRFSLTVYVEGLRRVGLPDSTNYGTVGFIEENPDAGIFYIAEGTPYVEYYVWHNLSPS